MFAHEQMSYVAAKEPRADTDIDSRERRLFQSLDTDNHGHVKREDFEQTLRDMGLSPSDPRLLQTMMQLDEYQRRVQRSSIHVDTSLIPLNVFCEALRPSIFLIERLLQGELVIPDFAEFCGSVEQITVQVRENRCRALLADTRCGGESKGRLGQHPHG